VRGPHVIHGKERGGEEGTRSARREGATGPGKIRPRVPTDGSFFLFIYFCIHFIFYFNFQIYKFEFLFKFKLLVVLFSH
jgi:hypothetical protein